MKGSGRGTHGWYIAIHTNSIPRAMAYLARKGVSFDLSSAKENNGVMNAVYLTDEVGGFALHLLRK